MSELKNPSDGVAVRFSKNCQWLAVFLMSVLLSGSAMAEWTGGIEGGTVVRDSGNATRLRVVLSNNTRPLSQYIYAEWLRSGAERNSYSVGYNPRYWLNNTYYTFGESEVRVDDFLGIDQELRLLAGLGGQFLNSAEQALYIELGVGGRSIEFDNMENTRNEALGLARLGYFRTVADAIKFDLKLSGGLSSDEVTEASGEIGVSLRVPNGAVRLAYRSRYLQVEDFESITDNDSFVSFGYSF
ncbi:MAG: DUF481 domain-containing protein [Granulosicoccus sp.]